MCGLGESFRINGDRSRFITVYFERAGLQPDSWSGWSELLDLEDMWTRRAHTFVYFWPGDVFHGFAYNPKFWWEEILMQCNTLLFQRTVGVQRCGSSLCFDIKRLAHKSRFPSRNFPDWCETPRMACTEHWPWTHFRWTERKWPTSLTHHFLRCPSRTVVERVRKDLSLGSLEWLDGHTACSPTRAWVKTDSTQAPLLHLFPSI